MMKMSKVYGGCFKSNEINLSMLLKLREDPKYWYVIESYANGTFWNAEDYMPTTLDSINWWRMEFGKDSPY